MSRPLLIAIREIPDAGRRVELDLAASSLERAVLAAYEATEPAHVALDVRRVGDSVLVQGLLRWTLRFQCSRTGAPGAVTLEVPVRELIEPADASHVALDDGVETELVSLDEPYVHDGDAVDLAPLVTEKLVLAQNPYPVLDSAPPAGGPVWTSSTDEVDPRWAKLQQIELG